MATPSDRLRKRIFADFSEHDAQHVVEDLLDVPESLPFGEAQDAKGAERLQACAVIPAEGDYSRFRERVELLHLDWRDALVSSGLEQDGWPRQLDRLLGPHLAGSGLAYFRRSQGPEGRRRRKAARYEVTLTDGSVQTLTLSKLDRLVGARRVPADFWACVDVADSASARGDIRAVVEWPSGRLLRLPAPA